MQGSITEIIIVAVLFIATSAVSAVITYRTRKKALERKKKSEDKAP